MRFEFNLKTKIKVEVYMYTYIIIYCINALTIYHPLNPCKRISNLSL